jgi:hypothetical protein
MSEKILYLYWTNLKPPGMLIKTFGNEAFEISTDSITIEADITKRIGFSMADCLTMWLEKISKESGIRIICWNGGRNLRPPFQQ